MFESLSHCSFHNPFWWSLQQLTLVRYFIPLGSVSNNLLKLCEFCLWNKWHRVFCTNSNFLQPTAVLMLPIWEHSSKYCKEVLLARTILWHQPIAEMDLRQISLRNKALVLNCECEQVTKGSDVFVHYLRFSQEDWMFSSSTTQRLLISVPGYPGCVSEIQGGLRFFQTLKSLLEIIAVLSHTCTHTNTTC